MKKFLFYLVFVAAFFVNQKLFAGGLSEEKTKVWRATEICGALLDSAVSTTTAYLYKIEVTSGSEPGLAEFQYINSSGAISDTGARRSTSTVFDVDTTGDDWEVRRAFSRGLRIRKTGTSCVTCLWDFLFFTPAGQTGMGYPD